MPLSCSLEMRLRRVRDRLLAVPTGSELERHRRGLGPLIASGNSETFESLGRVATDPGDGVRHAVAIICLCPLGPVKCVDLPVWQERPTVGTDAASACPGTRSAQPVEGGGATWPPGGVRTGQGSARLPAGAME